MTLPLYQPPGSWVGRAGLRRLVVLGAGLLGLAVGAAAQSNASPDSEALRLRPTSRLVEKTPDAAASLVFISGERIQGRPDLETVVEGDGELRRPGFSVHGDRIHYDRSSDVVSVEGSVRLNDRGNRYTAESGQLQLDSHQGFLLRPSYHFIATGGSGSADRVDFHDPDRTTVQGGDYTTCPRPGPDWVPDWVLRASQLDLDTEEDVGVARGAVLEFKGVPILAVPAMDFPLSEQRKSGWLPPTIGLSSKSGLQLELPYYWNIAPNRDATITPAVLARRGLELTGEFRYLEGNYNGETAALLLPGDRLRKRTRWGVSARHQGRHDTGLPGLGRVGLSLTLNRVSDNDYWRDFDRRGILLSRRLLDNQAVLSWSRRDVSVTARAQRWQTLQDLDAPITPPYDRLPQIRVRWRPASVAGLDYSAEADYTRFRGDPVRRRQPDAQRAYLSARLERPFIRPWGFLKPALQLHASHYSFENGDVEGRGGASRVVPTASLDSGIVLERGASYFGRGFTQTLEPRVKYVFTPHRRQNHLPNYDSGLYDFNFATIWSNNAFAGNDRISDNNLVTVGLSSRLLDQGSGAEALRLAVAQRYRFSPQRVVLPRGTPEDRGWSDLMLGAGVNWSSRWSMDTVLQYNTRSHHSSRITVSGSYRPGPYRTLAAAYRHERSVDNKQIDVAWQWPLNARGGARSELGAGRPDGASCKGQWYGVGRLNYSLSEHRLVDAVAGFEYDAGCWVGRVVLEKIGTGVASSTKRVMFQLELVGLSRVGTGSMETLRNSIPYYRPLRQDVVRPSRFVDYD